MELAEILKRCDHTLLKQGARAADIRQLCDEAIKYRCASVCIPPCHVSGAKKYVDESLKICTVIGFPNGYTTTATKVFEAKDAVNNGADEIDMVANIAMIKDGCWADVAADIRAVRAVTRGKVLKVIIETCLLTDEEKIRMCKIVADCGADYIKTSTGFSTGGATEADVALLRENSPETLKVKAAGGISSLEDAETYIRLGADRLGTSRIVKIAIAMEQEQMAQAAAAEEPAVSETENAVDASVAETASETVESEDKN